MDRLTSLRVFREAVEAGSFAAAAERLGLSAPMASKRIARLESEVGARLLHRNSRHLSLTEAGSIYYEQCRQALDLLDAAEAAVGQGAAVARGQLKVSAPVWCANARFAQALSDYRSRFPEVLVDMRLENRHVDLAADGYDLALRATHEPSPTLIARPMCPVRFELVATPAFLERRARGPDPEHAPLDFIEPSYIDLGATTTRPSAAQGVKKLLRMPLRPVLRSDDTTLSLHAVRAGMGAAFLPQWLVAEDLAAKRLLPVLGRRDQVPANTLFAVYASRRHMMPKLRSFIDFMSAQFAAA